VFRLAGIYGPGRSALDTLSNASGDMSQCGPNDVTLISRIHVEDICSVLKASMLSPTPGRLINVADDLPST
jgi:nucleoside-diphosphate-sugar epimerase